MASSAEMSTPDPEDTSKLVSAAGVTLWAEADAGAPMTMPPGASVYLANILALMSGLKLPWHRRRWTRAAREDLRTLVAVLRCQL